jgi:hypothetical protein
MVIKSMSRKTMSFMQLIDYISREGKAEGHPVFHNFSGDPANLLQLNRTFIRNARLCPPRKNGVILYHEILSLSPDDRPRATPAILAGLAERYLTLRAPQAIAWGRVHFGRNPHVHLVISANLKNQKKKLRLSKRDFSRVQRELEAYQKNRYPELSQSVVFKPPEIRTGTEKEDGPASARAEKERTTPALPSRARPEQERAKRLKGQGNGAQSTKEILRGQVLEALTAADSPEAFADRLNANNILLYLRNGSPAGCVSGNKKYRFTTLGLAPAMERAHRIWEEFPERLRPFRDAFAEHLRQDWRYETGYAEDLLDVLAAPARAAIPDPEQRRAALEVAAILRAKRAFGRACFLEPEQEAEKERGRGSGRTAGRGRGA